MLIFLKGATRVIHYHKHSVSQALVDLFPSIGLQKSNFWRKGRIPLASPLPSPPPLPSPLSPLSPLLLSLLQIC